MVALLVFITATLEIILAEKNLLDAKGLFGDNVIKNPAIYMTTNSTFTFKPYIYYLRASLLLAVEVMIDAKPNTGP